MLSNCPKQESQIRSAQSLCNQTATILYTSQPKPRNQGRSLGNSDLLLTLHPTPICARRPRPDNVMDKDEPSNSQEKLTSSFNPNPDLQTQTLSKLPPSKPGPPTPLAVVLRRGIRPQSEVNRTFRVSSNIKEYLTCSDMIDNDIYEDICLFARMFRAERASGTSRSRLLGVGFGGCAIRIEARLLYVGSCKTRSSTGVWDSFAVVFAGSRSSSRVFRCFWAFGLKEMTDGP